MTGSTDPPTAGPAGAPLRFGILGAARIATDALVSPAAETGDRLVAVAARSRARAESFAAEHGVARVCDDYAAVLADPGVEIVYNPLANGLHGPWNRAAVAAGLPVLTEKPFASNAAEAREVADAARAAGVAVIEAFHYLHHPVMRRVVALVAGGELGELRSVEATMVMPPPPEDDPRWSWELAGGATMDLGCYALHAARRLGRFAGGEPRVTTARAAERHGVDAWLAAELAYPGGATGTVRCSMVEPERAFGLRVVGSLGEVVAPGFVLPHLDDRVVVRTRGGERTERLGRRPSYHYQLDAVRASLRGTGSEPFPLDLDDAVANAELIDQAYLAAGLQPRPRSAG